MKRKISAILMATSFALAGVSATKTNNSMETSPNINIVSETQLKQNSLQLSELSDFDYNGGLPFDHWSFDDIDLSGERLV